jgi:hypothetical protein
MEDPTEIIQGEALDKSVELLSEHLEAGIIIGTYIDGDGITRKVSQSWGNDFAVSKMVEVMAHEVQIISEMERYIEREDE